MIFPFLAFAIAETGVPASDVGYKTGLVESLFTLTQFCVVLQIGRLSDRIGRKPVIVSRDVQDFVRSRMNPIPPSRSWAWQAAVLPFWHSASASRLQPWLSLDSSQVPLTAIQVCITGHGTVPRLITRYNTKV